MADCVLGSSRKELLSMPSLNSTTRRAAFSTSRSVGLSRDIVRLGSAQDSSTAEPIGTAFNSSTTNQVHLPAQNARQLFLHVHVVEQAPICPRCKSHQHIHIAIRSEV